MNWKNTGGGDVFLFFVLGGRQRSSKREWLGFLKKIHNQVYTEALESETRLLYEKVYHTKHVFVIAGGLAPQKSPLFVCKNTPSNLVIICQSM